MITGLSSEISVQLPGSAQLSATKEAGLIFESVLSGIVKGKEAVPVMQEGENVSPEMKDPEENTEQETTEQPYMNLFPYRILQDAKALGAGRHVPTDEKVEQTGTWLDSVAAKQLVITAKLDYSAPSIATPAQSEEVEAKSHMESLPLSDTAAIVTNSSESEAGEQFSIPKSRLESDAQLWADDLVKETVTMPIEQKMRQTERDFLLQESSPPDEFLTGFPESAATGDAEPESKRAEQSSELHMKETTIRQPSADKDEFSDSPEASAKAADSNGNKAHLNQGPLFRDPATENVFGHKSSKVAASHIEDIQKTIEMQIEKTPTLGNTVVKIRLTPDNIGDIHVQLFKTKDSITAVLHVQDAETKGLLDEKLTLLMEPFKHSVSEGPITLTVVADPSLAFSFSEGADPGNRKAERQEARKKTAKEKTETKDQQMKKQSTSGLSLLA